MLGGDLAGDRSITRTQGVVVGQRLGKEFPIELLEGLAPNDVLRCTPKRSGDGVRHVQVTPVEVTQRQRRGYVPEQSMEARLAQRECSLGLLAASGVGGADDDLVRRRTVGQATG